MVELLGLFFTSFLAATLVPMPSEAALWGYLMLYPDDAVTAVAVATLGNTLGGMTTYALGLLIPRHLQSRVNEKAIQQLRRFGAPLTFFAWLPIVGDALCAGAGWLRIRWWAALAFMAAGRLARYVAVVWLMT
ncbi:MAG TPA: YqaA family protein [Burkholderiales bacterium]|jgi:membrane protein YqaA with SNARE-associated domain